MSNKQFNARMQQKIDTYENWSKATNFIPLKGELIIYTTDENGNEKIGFKVGTGEPDKNVHQLDFISLGEAAAIISWNDLTDKPFGETGFKIEWDGTPTDEFFDVSSTLGAIIYKVGEAKTKEELIGATCKYILTDTNEEVEFIIESSQINDTDNINCFVIFDGSFGILAVALEAGTYNFMGISFEFSSAGTWFIKANDYYPTYVGNSEIKQLDEKYIPDIYLKTAAAGAPNGVATLDDAAKIPLAQLPEIDTGIKSWNELEDKPFYEKGTKITWDGTPTDTYVQPGQIIEWDGSDTGISLPIPANEDGTIPAGITFYKVAEKLDSLEGWTYIVSVNGIEEPLTTDNISIVLDGSGNVIATYGTSDTMYVWNVEQVAPIPLMGIEVTFPETGLYFINIEGQGRVSKIWNNTYNIMGETKLYKIKEPLNDGLGEYKLNVTSNGETIETVISSSSEIGMVYGETNTGSSYGAPYIFNILIDNETINLTDIIGCNITFPKAGLYFFDSFSRGVSFNYLISLDYELVKIDEKFLPEGFGGTEDCPTYTGGQINDTGDLNNLIVFNWYKLLTSLTADYKVDVNEALYDINSDHFTITFKTPSSITSDDYITIKIATGYLGSVDDPDFDNFTSNISVSLDTKELKSRSWYTAYCLYVESENKWAGYLISAASDTSGLEDNISYLESKVSDIQRQVLDRQSISNLVTSVNENSTDAQYPSAKLLYTTINTKQDKNLVTSINENSTDEQYPSAKLLYNIVGDCDVVLDEIGMLIGE